ncbi:MAG: hypothetical protein KAV82_13440 [Phycisphaerae bacterium]|nr:hypothetical protein [Phycisphaerae bacterium]
MGLLHRRLVELGKPGARAGFGPKLDSQMPRRVPPAPPAGNVLRNVLNDVSLN